VSTGAVVNAFLSFSKDFRQLSEKSQGTSFRVSLMRGTVISELAVNETPIEIGKPEERHDVPDLPGFGPVLDGLDLFSAIVRPSGDSI